MKKIFFVSLLLSSTIMFAQNRRTSRDRNQPSNYAPPTVQRSFQRDNPGVNDVRWSQSNNQWRANYNDNNQRNVDTYYDRNGIRKDTHTAWENKDVPQNVENRVNNRYHANGNYKVARIDRSDRQSLFQIRIQNGGKDRTIYMDENGRERRYNDHH